MRPKRRVGPHKKWHRISAVLSAMIMLVIAGGLYQRLHNPQIVKPIVWLGGGICFSRDGGKHVTSFPPRTQSGKELDSARFALRHESIVYWSAPDTSLCIVPSKGNPHWIALSKQNTDKSIWDLDPNWSSGVFEVEPTVSGVVLNVNPYSQRNFAIEVNFKTRQAKRFDNAAEVKATADSDRAAVLYEEGGIAITSLSSKRTLSEINLNITITAWDYEPLSQTLCATDGTSIVLRKGNEMWTWKVKTPFAADHVVINRSNGQIWVSAGLPFDWQQRLLVYSHTGKFLGEMLRSNVPIGTPILDADEGLLDLLKHIQMSKA